METATLVIQIALVIVSILLITVVLMQKTKSGGVGAAFGSDTQSFTSKGKAASKEAKLKKLTIIFAVIIGVLAIVLSVLR